MVSIISPVSFSIEGNTKRVVVTLVYMSLLQCMRQWVNVESAVIVSNDARDSE